MFMRPTSQARSATIARCFQRFPVAKQPLMVNPTMQKKKFETAIAAIEPEELPNLAIPTTNPPKKVRTQRIATSRRIGSWAISLLLLFLLNSQDGYRLPAQKVA